MSSDLITVLRDKISELRKYIKDIEGDKHVMQLQLDAARARLKKLGYE